MAVASVFWADNSALDLHLVPGYTGPRLDHLLWIEDSGGTTRADSPPAGVVVGFAGNFTVGPGTAGVTVSATGEVTVAALAGAPRLLDFLVIATVTEGANTFTAYKRIRIHNSIIRTWLTPEALTVRQGAGGMRPTLLAEFDDGTYGDITNWCPWDAPAATDRTYVRRNGTNPPAAGWTTSAAAIIDVHPDTGLLNGRVAAGNATITATIQPAAPTNTATGTARAAAAWTTPVTLTPISGPGFAAMGASPNILILPDGFGATDRAAFEKLSRDLVNRLNVRRRTRPFDLLKDTLNYFSAWVASPEPGVSPLPEIQRLHIVGSNADAIEQDTTVASGATGTAWHVAAPPTPGSNDRYLLNERDTAFHIVLGERPSAQEGTAIRSAFIHPSRYDERNLDDFYGNLRDGGGNKVGGVWVRGGKDEDRVVILSRSLRNGGSNNPRSPTGKYIGMTLDRHARHHIRDNVTAGKDLVPDPIPGTVSIEIWMTAAHELGHSFTLGDEYGSSGSLPATEVAYVNSRSNLEVRSNLLTGGNLDPTKVKWRWPRITKAGVLAAIPLDLMNGKFRVRLEVGHGAAFAVNDVVKFRVRPLVGAPPATHRFKITSKAADEVEVRPLAATPFVPGNFPAGSVLISPRRAPDPNPASDVYGDDLSLIHTGTVARMTATRNPLNATDGDPPNRPCPGGGLPTPTPATNFPGGTAPKPPAYSSWIVGLFENGDDFACDVYRPTGICIMRALHYVEKPTKNERSYQFCPVCRYGMVDLLDPSKHGAIDADYDLRYPT